MKITKEEAFEVLIQLLSNEMDFWDEDYKGLAKRHSERDMAHATDVLNTLKIMYKDKEFKDKKDFEKRYNKRIEETEGQ